MVNVMEMEILMKTVKKMKMKTGSDQCEAGDEKVDCQLKKVQEGNMFHVSKYVLPYA
jgi:hypothetical protein